MIYILLIIYKKCEIKLFIITIYFIYLYERNWKKYVKYILLYLRETKLYIISINNNTNYI